MIQAGKLRFAVDVEQMRDGDWQPYFATRLDIRTVSEGQSERHYLGTGRWRTEWDQVAGLATHSSGFRVVWTYGEKDGQALVRYLYIDEIVDPDNRRREIRLGLREVVED